jgi:hypothetical protein
MNLKPHSNSAANQAVLKRPAKPRPVASHAQQNGSLEAVYAILSERYASGEHDVAARHHEHQP